MRKQALSGSKEDLNRETLLGFVASGNPEGHAPVIVGFRGCGQVEISQRNLFPVLGSEVPERLADYGVVLNFLLMLIAEDQNCAGHDLGCRWRCLRVAAG